MTTDLVWDALVRMADGLNTHTGETTLTVRAARRRSLVRWQVSEGLNVVDDWTDVFEPVRQRRLFSAAWEQVQAIEEAASGVRAFLRERPDMSDS